MNDRKCSYLFAFRRWFFSCFIPINIKIKSHFLIANWYQIIKDNNEAKFAVIGFDEYLYLKDLLSDEEKLEDYLDYLHVLRVRKHSKRTYSFEEVKRELAQSNRVKQKTQSNQR